MRCRGDKIWYQCKSETKFMDYFTNSEIFSAQYLSLMLVTKSTCTQKRKPLLVTNINNNLSDSVVEGTAFTAVTFANSSNSSK